MINWQCLLLPLFTVRQYLFCANSIVCYSFKTHPSIPNATKYIGPGAGLSAKAAAPAISVPVFSISNTCE